MNKKENLEQIRFDTQIAKEIREKVYALELTQKLLASWKGKVPEKERLEMLSYIFKLFISD